jgi:copper homeostasis protein
MVIEIVVYNIESALNAQEGGADRIELCDNPSEGGTTPSFGMIEQVRNHVAIQVFVMIRPRGGDFCYTDLEVEAMKRDIEVCKQLKVDGVVFGILDQDGRIDKARCKELIEFARPLGVTCHRAFDMTRDAYEALEDCIDAGFDRILTSGRQPSAPEGSELIRELVKHGGKQIVIMPGSGINEQNVKELIEVTGVTEIHFSAKKFIQRKNTRYNHLISFLDVLPGDSGQFVADVDVIRQIKNKIKATSLN